MTSPSTCQHTTEQTDREKDTVRTQTPIGHRDPSHPSTGIPTNCGKHLRDLLLTSRSQDNDFWAHREAMEDAQHESGKLVATKKRFPQLATPLSLPPPLLPRLRVLPGTILGPRSLDVESRRFLVKVSVAKMIRFGPCAGPAWRARKP